MRPTPPIALAAFVVVAPLHAESFESKHARDVAANPADLHFHLSTKDPARAFRIGERIPIVLSFSSDTPARYRLDAAAYDRSGRLPSEEFVAEHDNLVDPYAEYFGSGVMAFLGGGLRGIAVLEAKPVTVELSLNDWFRFDAPGRYRFYLKSHRVSRERRPDEPGDRRVVDFAAVSNIFEVEIVREAGWEASKLREIRAALSKPEPSPDSLSELRYLATPAAIRLAFEYAAVFHGPDILLLTAARDRADMLKAFDAHLANPRVAIAEWAIRERALFTFLQQDSPRPLAGFGWAPLPPERLKALRAEAEARYKRYQEIVKAEAIRLIPAVSHKDETARQESAKAIEALAPAEARAAGLVPPEDYGLSRDELIRQFLSFPPDRQSELLNKKWDLVRGPEVVPSLKAVIARAVVANRGPSIAEDALRRLLELAPAEAEALFAKDLASGEFRLAAFAGREIPAREIPSADPALSTLLDANQSTALPLIARFASPSLAARVEKLYDGHSWACAEEEWMVGYLVRVTNGSAVLARAMANRKGRGCYRTLLGRVAEIAWTPAVEAQAIATLSDPDAQTAANAAQTLAAHGGARVEAPLWKRLEAWSERWRGRAAELETNPITSALPNPEAQLGSALFQSIASARGWVLDPARRQRLTGLCIDEDCRKQWAESPAQPLVVEIASGGAFYPPAFRVGSYTARTLPALKEKLAQYPPGTAFSWSPQSFNFFSPGQLDAMFRDVSAFLAARAMTLRRP
ncbi:MAG: hypothetical protein JSU00_24590 [Acidobacteria bacterium]|nr:hypothetical protein [Acidobacteriota bacterium]